MDINVVGAKAEPYGLSTWDARLLTGLMPHMFSDISQTIRDTAAMSKAELDFRLEATRALTSWLIVGDGFLSACISGAEPAYGTCRALRIQLGISAHVTKA